jgi:TatD DNase family protein
MIDVHNHLQDPRFCGEQERLVTAMREAGITACVVNGTCEEDWPEVARLAERHPDFVIPAFGLHPWKVAARSSSWLDTLAAFLESHPGAGLGECGLDRWMKNPDLEAQHEVFRAQLKLARDLHRPATVHCLRAWGPLLDDLKAIEPRPRFLLHSYGGSGEFARQCLDLGAWFSFSGYFLHPRKVANREVFAALPTDRILVETDAPDMAPPDPPYHFGMHNHPANLPFIAEKLAVLCGCPVDTFARNAKKFLGRSDEELSV